MPDSQYDEEVAPGTEADTNPEETEEADRRRFFLAALDLVLTHPTGQKWAIAAVCALFLLGAFGVHHLALQFSAEDTRTPARGRIPTIQIGPVEEDDPGEAPEVIVKIPEEFTRKGTAGERFEAEEKDGCPGVPVRPLLVPAPPAPPEEIAPPPRPARYLPNPAVEEDISLNHRDAVTTNTELVTRGFERLPEGSRAWVVRRFDAEARAFAAAVDAGSRTFADLGYRGDALLLGKKQFTLVATRLREARGRLRPQMTDGECSRVLEQLKLAAQFLEAANRGSLRLSPVTVPDFTEKVNPAWLDWQRRYGGNPQE